MVRHAKMGNTIKRLSYAIPRLDIEPTVQPITRTGNMVNNINNALHSNKSPGTLVLFNLRS